MNTTQLEDTEVIRQVYIWLIRYSRNPKFSHMRSAQYLRGIVDYWDEHNMITRSQRMQVDAILWETGKTSRRPKKNGNKTKH